VRVPFSKAIKQNQTTVYVYTRSHIHTHIHIKIHIYIYLYVIPLVTKDLKNECESAVLKHTIASPPVEDFIRTMLLIYLAF
jgi:hypothetical protein